MTVVTEIDRWGCDHQMVMTIPPRLAAGLADDGLVGLALWPESLRYLFTFEENGPPIVSPSDLAGTTTFTIGSSTQNEIMTALGATPVDVFRPTPWSATGRCAAVSTRCGSTTRTVPRRSRPTSSSTPST
jgi:hypothetical protein